MRELESPANLAGFRGRDRHIRECRYEQFNHIHCCPADGLSSMTRRKVPLEVRFWQYVDKSGECWLWTGGASGEYGRVMDDAPSRRKLLAHRVSYEMANGPIPEGMVVDHRCHVTLCVNPAHLRAVTSKQNNEHKVGATRISKSGYLGVYEYIPGWWRGSVKHYGQTHYTGRCATPEEADVAVKALRNALFTHNDHDRVKEQA